jgi:hypothetical protein
MQQDGDVFNRRQISARQQDDLLLPRDTKARFFDNDAVNRDTSAFDIPNRLSTGTIEELGHAFGKTD